MFRVFAGKGSILARCVGAAVLAVGVGAAMPAAAGDFGWAKRDDGPRRHRDHSGHSGHGDHGRWHHDHQRWHQKNGWWHGDRARHDDRRHDHSRWGRDHSGWHSYHPVHNHHPAYRPAPSRPVYGHVPPQRPTPPAYYYHRH